MHIGKRCVLIIMNFIKQIIILTADFKQVKEKLFLLTVVHGHEEYGLVWVHCLKHAKAPAILPAVVFAHQSKWQHRKSGK